MSENKGKKRKLFPKGIKISKKKLYIFLGVFILMILIFPIVTNAGPGLIEETVIGLLTFIVSLIIKGLTMLLSVVMIVFRWLLEPEQISVIDKEVVKVGWPIVRDLFNMVFILALLFIAFTTVLKISNYQWNKLLARLVIMAILVNFSRTICGIIIDLGNVVMFSFAKALGDIAGSGFIGLLGVDKLMNYAAAPDVNTGTAKNIGNAFLVAVLSLVFGVIMLVVVTMITMVLAWRMVYLWILVVLSPLAYVLKVLPMTEKYASDWWKEFGSTVAVGPFLVFFVWLSITTLNTYNTNIPDNGSAIASVIQADHLAAFIVGILMLLAGLIKAGELGGMTGNMAGKAANLSKKGWKFAGKQAAAGGAAAVGAGARRMTSAGRADIRLKKLEKQKSRIAASGAEVPEDLMARVEAAKKQKEGALKRTGATRTGRLLYQTGAIHEDRAAAKKKSMKETFGKLTGISLEPGETQMKAAGEMGKVREEVSSKEARRAQLDKEIKMGRNSGTDLRNDISILNAQIDDLPSNVNQL